MKKLLLTLLLLSFIFQVYSQKLINIKKATICDKAIEISTLKMFGPTTEPGTIDVNSKNLFVKKEHPVWYKFKIEKEGVLLFDINPLDSMDNYDFILYKVDDEKSFCANIKSDKNKPIVGNFYRTDIMNKGKTGLSINGDEKAYSKGIDVKKGDLYYLALNNMYKGKGHTISFKYLETLFIEGIVMDKQNGKPINKAIVSWENMRNKEEYFYTTTNKKGEYKLKIHVSSEAHAFPRYNLMAYSNEGYFFKDTTILSKDLESIKNKKYDFKLSTIKKGYNYEQLPNIYFEPNTDVVVKESEKSINKLIKLMSLNKNIKVELEGHTNGFYPSTEVDEVLSRNRAQGIYDYLIKKGVDGDRLDVKALGCTKLMYEFPENETEEGFNRRVEIKISDF